MATELKTKATDSSVNDFLNEITDTEKRETCIWLKTVMENVTGAPAKMWGNAIVGFGDYKYRYPDGRTNDWFYMGFSPRKQNIALYILGCTDLTPQNLGPLGKYKTAKSCIYINKLSDIDQNFFKSLCQSAYMALK